MQTHCCLIIYLNIQQHFSTYLPTYLPYPYQANFITHSCLSHLHKKQEQAKLQQQTQAYLGTN